MSSVVALRLDEYEAPEVVETEHAKPERWWREYGDVLYRYALARLGDPDLARDTVQEALASALKAAHGFQGRSAEQTWLVGILRHKIIDHYRKNGRETKVFDRSASSEDAELTPARQAAQTPSWADPALAAARTEFWEALRVGLEKMPKRLAEAYRLVEIEQLDTDTVCERLEVTKTNLWVMLYRARKHLKKHFETTGYHHAPLAKAV